jgi:amino-acid N-acetyltransferase
METIIYCPASPEDFAGVRSLLERCDLPTADLRPDHLEHFVLCRRDAELVGTIGLELLGEVALLRSLAVAPEGRGRGLGRDLWQRACDHARNNGIRQLYLLTTTAEGLFANWGFRRVSREAVPDAVRGTSEYSAVCPSTATVMVTDLK